MKNFPNVKIIEELTAYLNHRQIPTEDLCRYLIYNTFRELSATSVAIADIGKNETVGWTKAYGKDGNSVEIVRDISKNEEIPVAYAIRNDTPIWLDLRENQNKKFPGLTQLSIYRKGVTCIVWPFHRFNVPIGAMAVYSDLEIKQSQNLDEFFTMIGNLVAMRFHAQNLELPIALSDDVERSRYHDLSDRKKMILELMIQNKSNVEIARILHCEEFEIRGEALLIYQTLYAGSRLAAIEIGLRHGIRSQTKAL